MKYILLLFIFSLTTHISAQKNALHQLMVVRSYLTDESTDERKFIFYNDCNNTIDINGKIFSFSDVNISFYYDSLFYKQFFIVLIKCKETNQSCIKDDMGLSTKGEIEIQFPSKEKCEGFINRLNSLKEALNDK